MKGREPRWLPLLRTLAAVLFVAMGALMAVSYRQHSSLLRHRTREVTGARLDARLVSVSENIHHLHTQGNRPVFLLTAARDEVYDDGHHQLSGVSLTLYAPDGTERARITARHAVSYPASGLVIFARDVVAWTREGVRLRTDELHYDRATEVVRTERPVAFEHPNAWGESQSAEVRFQGEQHPFVLLRTVRLRFAPKESATEPRLPWTAHAEAAFFDRAMLAVQLVGDVRIRRGAEDLRADRLEGRLDRAHRIRELVAEGGVRLHSRTAMTTGEITSERLLLFLTERQDPARALALGSVFARWHSRTGEQHLHGPRVELTFAARGGEIVPRSAWADGERVSVALRRSSDSASDETRVQAHRVEVLFREETGAPHRVRASGDVHLELLPTRSTPPAEKKTISAREAELELEAERSRVTRGRAEGDVRVEIEPREGTKRVLQSAALLVRFDPETQKITHLIHSGQVRYWEGDRRAQSEHAIYEAESGWIRLRGGDPTVWDARGRTRATELDVNPREERSSARGRVVTMYIPHPENARPLPFSERDAPIFIAADRLEVDHRARWARYTGAVRAWQQEMYLTAEELELREGERLLIARGHVHSALFRARRAEMTSDDPIPVVVSAARLTYRETERTLLYEGGVSLHRGSQRLTAESLAVVMKPDTAEIERALAERHVVLTEAERRAYAERAMYEARGETLVLEGTPARVEDDRHRILQQGARLTFLGGGDKVLIEDGEGARRVRTVRLIPRGKP
jgi:LPS export ABC transporter protein LptC/lipopolysaccharide transport protein LptA